MSNYIVTPLEGFNDVRYGMSREEVRRILGTPIREFKKTKYSKNTTDDFGMYHIYYDSNNRFEAVEFFEGASICDNRGNAFPKTAEALTKLPYHFESDSESYICFDSSIGIYAPSGNIESILFGVNGYF